MARTEHNTAYEARQRAKGMVRGPRITAAAADELHRLSYLHRLTPSQVVSSLILGTLRGSPPLHVSFQERERLSDEEVAFARSIGLVDPDAESTREGG